MSIVIIVVLYLAIAYKLRQTSSAFESFTSEMSVHPGVNVIKGLHLYFTRVAIVSLAENNSCTCKLQV